MKSLAPEKRIFHGLALSRVRYGNQSPAGLLAIDVGNTSTLFGYFEGKILRKSFRMPTANMTVQKILSLKKIFPVEKLEAAVIASVVPQAGFFLRKRIPILLKLNTFLVGKDLEAPVVNRYRHPRQVGADRLMNAVAAFQKYRQAVIIVDFGTAITFDVVSGKGEYLGGVIAPGIEISLEALFRKTALLPKIRLAHPAATIGRDTVESIRIGCSFGIAGLCERVVREIRRSRRENFKVIATGGYARFLSRYCGGIIDRIEPHLTLQGIRLTYLKNA